MAAMDWLHDQRTQALLEYQTLTFLRENVDAKTGDKLQKECGHSSMLINQLRPFMQKFNVLFLDTSAIDQMMPGVDGLDVNYTTDLCNEEVQHSCKKTCLRMHCSCSCLHVAIER